MIKFPCLNFIYFLFNYKHHMKGPKRQNSVGAVVLNVANWGFDLWPLIGSQEHSQEWSLSAETGENPDRSLVWQKEKNNYILNFENWEYYQIIIYMPHESFTFVCGLHNNEMLLCSWLALLNGITGLPKN